MARYRLTVEVDDPRPFSAIAQEAAQILAQPQRWQRLVIEQVDEGQES